VWTPETENGQKQSAALRVSTSNLSSNKPLPHHSLNFIDTLSDDEDAAG
jgi:hypothetical protein